MIRRLALCFFLLATAGVGCGEECMDLSVKECKSRRDCSPTRMRVRDAKGSHDKVVCVERGRG